MARIPAPSKPFLLCNKGLREVGVTQRVGKGNYVEGHCCWLSDHSQHLMVLEDHLFLELPKSLKELLKFNSASKLGRAALRNSTHWGAGFTPQFLFLLFWQEITCRTIE